MRRHQEVEEEFSSNSFLDVICNVVGILIVLIVIAGVRTRPAPRPSVPASEQSAPVLSAPAEPDPVSEEPEPATEVAADEPDEPEMLAAPDEELPPLELPELSPPKELVDRVRQLEAELAALRSDQASVGQALSEQHRRQTELSERLETARSLLAEKQSALNSTLQKQSEQKEDLRLARQTQARLLAQLKAEKGLLLSGVND